MSSNKFLDEINPYRSIIKKSLTHDEQIDCWNDYQDKELSKMVHGYFEEIEFLVSSPIHNVVNPIFNQKYLKETERLGLMVCNEIIEINTQFEDCYLEF